MKLLTTFLLILSLCVIGVPISAATVTGRSEDTTLAGTEKIPADSSGVDTYILVSTLRNAMVLSGGLTGNGSSAWDWSGSTGTFKTSSGVNTFGGSANTFAATISPLVSDGAALGTVSLMWSDLFLASGAVININNSNWVATHTSGILTVGTGDLRVTTAGTNTASVVTVGGTQELSAKTLTAQVVKTGLTASGSASNDFSSSTGAFKTSSGANTFGGSSHSFASKLFPATDDGAALGDTTHNFSDIFLATGAVLNYANGNVVLTHTSGVLTLGTGNLIVSTAGTAAGSVLTNNGTQTATNKTLTAPVINGVSSASGNFDLSGSSGTFKTTSGASTFGGSSATFASAITPATDDTGALGSASLQWSDLFLASGAVIKFASTDVVLTHSTGILTMGTGELRVTTAGTNAASVLTQASTNDVSNKTMVAQVVKTGLTASGSAANDFSGSTGTFLTSTGTNTLGGNTVTSSTFIQTSASSAAFASGLAGNTNPVFRLVNNISSQATGISITGRAAAAGADITVLSSATDENLVINAKGAGTITLNPTATGNVVVKNGQVEQKVTTISGDGAVTIASGVVVLTKGSAAAITVAAPSSNDGVRITIISNSDFAHVITFTGATLLDGTTGANTTVTFTAFKGSAITVIAVGTKWLLESQQTVTSIVP